MPMATRRCAETRTITARWFSSEPAGDADMTMSLE